MKDGIAEMIVKQNWPLLKVTSGAYTEEIERDHADQRAQEHRGRTASEIIRFGDFSITMDQNDKERLDKLVDRIAYVSGMGSAPGGMAAYQQLAQAEMMMGAADGMKKGGDGGGAVPGRGHWHGLRDGRSDGRSDAQTQEREGARAGLAAPESRGPDHMATLKQLGELKAAGILTDAEFEAKKKDLLAKLQQVDVAAGRILKTTSC